MAEITTIQINSHLWMDIGYSADDGGYYAEVFAKNGKDLYTTDVHTLEADAARQAYEWVNTQAEAAYRT